MSEPHSLFLAKCSPEDCGDEAYCAAMSEMAIEHLGNLATEALAKISQGT
jgi:hypothetical protein